MIVLTIVVVLGLLIAANALYVAGEFGAVSVSKQRVQALAETGHAGAKRLLPHVTKPAYLDRYIAACQVGITFSSLLLGAYGQAALAPLVAAALGDLGGLQWAAASSAAFVIVLIGLSMAQMVLGELVPKAIALQFPVKSALFTERPMAWSLRVFAPLIWLFNGSGNALLRLIGLEHGEHRHVHSAGEIDLILAEGKSAGGLDAEERSRLRRALRLSSREAVDLMVPRHRIVAIDVETTLADAVLITADAPYTRFPVYRGDLDDIVGVLHSKDLVRAQMYAPDDGAGETIAALLRPTVTAPLTATADQLLVLLRESKSSQAMVVDSQNRVAGLITLGGMLGELFGRTGDEFKSGPPRSWRRG